MKALRNRYKNIQFIKTMWMSGNIKVANKYLIGWTCQDFEILSLFKIYIQTALDAAVNLDDVSLMADILNQINSSM